MQQRSEEWFQARKGRVTGSMVGAILGCAPYMTREQAMRSMVRSYHGAESEFTGNVATEYGTANEDGARWQFELETGLTVEDAPFVPFEDWLGASPDGYVGDTALIEIKCPYGLRDKNPPEFKSIHDQPHYYAQIQVQLYVTKCIDCYFYQWSPFGSKLEIVCHDQNWIDQNLPILRQFYAEYLSEIDNPEHLEPLRKEINTQESRLLLDEYDQLSEAIDNATQRKKEVMETLQGMADGKSAMIWGRKLTKIEKEGSVKYAEVVKKHLPDLDLTPYKGKSSVSWRLT